MKEKILFKCYSGSRLYGTNGENSDVDIKGVFLPELNDLILGKAPKHYVSTTGKNNEKNGKDDVDETYYSLHYFLDLAAKGDTNAIDILFAYTNYEAVIIDSPIWSEIIDNIDKIITKNVKAYLGYCKSQCIKYSVKGEKLKNFIEFEKFLKEYLEYKNDCGEYITLFTALSNEFDFSVKDLPEIGMRKKLEFSATDVFDFGDHCYFDVALNKEKYLSISDVKFQLDENIMNVLRKINKVIASYGKRAEASANNNGVDWKAISHCVRVLFQVEELLTTNKITFPLKEAEFIKSIKYNKSNMTYDEIIELIEKKIGLIDNNLLPNSNLREKADYKWIEKFILKQYLK